jgi:hypothetical protein
VLTLFHACNEKKRNFIKFLGLENYTDRFLVETPIMLPGHGNVIVCVWGAILACRVVCLTNTRVPCCLPHKYSRVVLFASQILSCRVVCLTNTRVSCC